MDRHIKDLLSALAVASATDNPAQLTRTQNELWTLYQYDQALQQAGAKTLCLHPRAFGPGRAVSTTVGPVPVLLWQVGHTGDVPTYRLFPRSSFADYLARRLIDAMTEYRAPALP
ncbi:hypothetical protein [Streptomyces sp. TRM68416]|uniref:hypothetical protein n=1 Tax=Streptomyces sp. TRM68416 TaxID=2758412 RepID=UPI001CB70DEB|nr:hypothetical protein [Streptomyces sp. TRM68416]